MARLASASVASASTDPEREAYLQQFRDADPTGRFYTPASPDYVPFVGPLHPDDADYQNFVKDSVSQYGTAGFSRDGNGNLRYTNSTGDDVAVLYAARADVEAEGIQIVHPGQTVTLPSNALAATAQTPRSQPNTVNTIAVAAPGHPPAGGSGQPGGGTTGGGYSILHNSEGDSGFFGDFARGLGLAGFGNAIGEIFNLGHSPALGFISAVKDIVTGWNEIVEGASNKDLGTIGNGLVDVGSGAVGVAVRSPVGAVLSLGAQLTKLYASFWVPIGNSEQVQFLNFIGQCEFHKDTDNLSANQAGQISDRYSGGWGLANLMSDYSNYKLRDVHHFFGQTGCP